MRKNTDQKNVDYGQTSHNVHDILRIIKQQFIQAKLMEINALHPYFKFTIEVEGKLPFLNLCINHLRDSWFAPGIVKLLPIN